MSAPRFTPGPWSVPHQGPREEGWDVLAGKKRKKRVALIPGSNNHQRIPDDEDRANARIIAAAPDLHEALRLNAAALDLCIRYFLGAGSQPDPEQMAKVVGAGRDALAKAEGR